MALVKNLSANAGDLRDVGSIPGSGRCPGGVYGNPLLHSCLESPLDRGACGLQSIGSHRVRHNWSDLAHTQATRAQKNILDSFLPHCWIFLGLIFWFFFSLLIFKHWSAHGFNPSPLYSLPTVTPLVISFSMMTLVAMITWWFPDLYSQSWHLCLTPKLGDLIGISNLICPELISWSSPLKSLFLQLCVCVSIKGNSCSICSG